MIKCTRCGGAGNPNYASWNPFNYGNCFRCGGSGDDPKGKRILKALHMQMQEAMKAGKTELVEFFTQLINQVGEEEKDMCGMLKLEKMHQCLGDRVSVLGPKGEGTALFSGFVRKDKQKWWEIKGDAVRVHVRADAFIEGQVTFKVPGNKLEAMGLRKDVFIRKQGDWERVGAARTVRVITRNAMNPLERGLHDRWPLVMVDGEVHEFTYEDILSGPAQQELPL